MDMLVQDVLQQLECPVCYEYMVPPIILCTNGHNICMVCRPNFVNCPSCRCNLLDATRNRTAEIVSAMMTHACRYRRSGCTGHFLLVFKKAHENACLFRPHRCPFTLEMECEWEGPRFDIFKHVRDSHVGLFCLPEGNGGSQNIKIDFFIDDCSCPDFWSRAIRALDEVFFFQCTQFDEILYVKVLYVGEEEMSTCFMYTATVRHKNNIETMSAQLLCQSYYLFLEDFRFWNERCAVFPVSFLEQCMDPIGMNEIYIQIKRHV